MFWGSLAPTHSQLYPHPSHYLQRPPTPARKFPFCLGARTCFSCSQPKKTKPLMELSESLPIINFLRLWQPNSLSRPHWEWGEALFSATWKMAHVLCRAMPSRDQQCRTTDPTTSLPIGSLQVYCRLQAPDPVHVSSPSMPLARKVMKLLSLEG